MNEGERPDEGLVSKATLGPSSHTVKVVIAPDVTTSGMSICRVYLADTPDKPIRSLPSEARSSAICLALERAARQVARNEVDFGTRGNFEVKVEIEKKE
jgi:hypothetical protein